MEEHVKGRPNEGEDLDSDPDGVGWRPSVRHKKNETLSSARFSALGKPACWTNGRGHDFP